MLRSRTLPRTTGIYIWLTSYLGFAASNGWIRATGKVLAFVLMAIVTACWKAHSFLHWATSKKASTALQQERNSQCDECKLLEVLDDGRRFCGGCGCPKSKWSELTTKNSRQGHNCPMGTHRGSRRLGRIPGCKGCGRKTMEAEAIIDPQI